jgi:hypothetical protein
MKCRILKSLLALLLLQPLSFVWADAPSVAMGEQHKPMFQEHCISCHGEKKQKGKFRVDTLPFEINTVQDAERWQQVLDAMNSGDMPPDDEEPVPALAKTNFLDDLSNTMVTARKVLGDQKGVITMRRLNRREYRNTLRELLGVGINVTELPSDAASEGFDTSGSNLFMSGNQFEQYQSLGREALTEAFERQANAAVEKKEHYEAETWTPIVRDYVAHQADARDRANKWVKAVEEAAARPENAEIVAKIREEVKNNEGRFRREWARIPGAPDPFTFGFDKGNENDADLANSSLGEGWQKYHEYYLQQQQVETGAYLGVQTMHPATLNVNFIQMLVPFGWPVGNYVVRVRAAATEDAPPGRKFVEFGVDARSGGQILSTHEVTGTMENPQIIEIPLTMTRGNAERNNRTMYLRERGSWDTNPQGGRVRGEALKQNGIGPELVLWVDWWEIERIPDADQPKPVGIAALGIPLDDKSTAPTAEEMRTAIERFSVEAFRGRKPTANFVDGIHKLYDVRIAAGDKHTEALKESLSVVLASPPFIYLSEPAGDAHRKLTDAELASRLSYFLWSAPPDANLRDLAARGELSKPEILAAETTRLLDDPRSEGFVDSFTYQWLGMFRFDFFTPNQELYPKFHFGTKIAAGQEVYETMSHVLRQNAPLTDLLKSDYVVVNSELATFYDLPNVHGDQFRKVNLPANSPRGGLLGMSAIQFMGGNGEHTSPVERGAWVLRKLLNDAPPPAPPNVPALTRLADKVLTTRERMMAHQEDAQCASCHRKIDPIGFGLENFDAVGQWRTEDSYVAMNSAGKPDPKSKKTWQIDPSSKLHKGPAFQDYFELRDIVASKSDEFARGFSSALIEYGLGRSSGFSDEPLIDDLLQKAQAKNWGMREFIHDLIQSKEFHTK